LFSSAIGRDERDATGWGGQNHSASILWGAVSWIPGGCGNANAAGRGAELTWPDRHEPAHAEPWPWGRLSASREPSSIPASRANGTLKRAIRLADIVLRSPVLWFYGGLPFGRILEVQSADLESRRFLAALAKRIAAAGSLFLLPISLDRHHKTLIKILAFLVAFE
jgi:hypothetical protein